MVKYINIEKKALFCNFKLSERSLLRSALILIIKKRENFITYNKNINNNNDTSRYIYNIDYMHS